MLVTSLKGRRAYDLTEPKFRAALDFLARGDLDTLPEGWMELENGLRAGIQHYRTALPRELRFESHERYYDIQYMVRGSELIGVCPREGLTVSVPYDAATDNTFYRDPEVSGAVLLREGQMAVLSPEDVHKPRCAAGEPEDVFKIVLKVPV